MSRPDEAGGVSGRESAPRGASGDGSRMDEPTSSANLDGTRGSAPGTPIVEACEHFWVKPDGAGPSTRECTLCGAVTAVLL